MIRIGRLPFVILGMISLITGLLAGLQRIGWDLDMDLLSQNHGSIMVGGFIGTLIALEKVIPLKRNILFVIPLTSAGSVIVFFFGLAEYSIACLLAASAGLSVVFAIYWLRERSVVYALMFAGAACWLTGNILLAKNGFYPISIPWWMGFALLVITAERLELTKFLPVSVAQRLLLLLAAFCFVLGCIISFHGAGKYIVAVALVAIPVWLLRHDVVILNLKKEQLSKYVGISLLSGYIALLLSGFLLPGTFEHAFGYDVLVHTFFVGFVFSMIFAHGPIILPGVLGITLKPFHPIFYLWLTLLHVSWIARAAADFTLNMHLRKYSGLASAVAIVGYFLSLALLTIRSYRGRTA